MPSEQVKLEQPLGKTPEAFIELLTVAKLGFSVVAYQRLKMLGCPSQFIELMVLVRASLKGFDGHPELVLFEMFCGVAAIAREFAKLQLPAMGFDVLKDPVLNDILTPYGFIYATTMVMSLDQRTGILWLATVCSSWVWMSRNSTGRSIRNPLGGTGTSTTQGNTMVARCSLLVLVCIAVGNSWALEQPATSFMVMHPAMAWIRSFHGRVNNASWYQCDTCMGAFGAKTVKPTKIYGNRRLVLALGRSQAGVRGDSNTVTTVKVDPVTGVRSTNGGPGLKETQAYTPGFGAAVLEAYLACGGAEPPTLSEPGLDRPWHVPAGVWELADLQSVLQVASGT